MAKGGSKFVSSLIAFFLGFFFAIIVEVGAIFGIGYYALNTNLNSLFNTVGFANQDSTGKQYVNTNTDDGGVYNLWELITKLRTMGGEIGTVTLGDFEKLFPASDSLTKSLYSALSGYAEINEEELESTKFTDLGTYLTDVVMDIRPGTVMKTAGMDGAMDNAVVKAILYGVESKYVYVDSEDANSLKYPLYYDEYTYDSQTDRYYRTSSVDNMDVYPSNIYDVYQGYWLTETTKSYSDGMEDDTTDEEGEEVEDKVTNGKEGIIYRQYYYNITVGDDSVYVVTRADDDGNYIYSDLSALSEDEAKAVMYYTAYGDDGIEQGRLKGNYYYDNDGNEIFIKPITLRTLSEDAMAPLDEMPVTELLGDDKIITELFGNDTVGALVSNEVDISDRVNNMSLSVVMDIDPTQNIIMYLAYNVTDLVQRFDGEGNAILNEDGSVVYDGVYAKGTDDEKNVIVSALDGKVTFVEDVNGEEIKGTKVNEVSDHINNLKLCDVITVSADDSIMAYISYGITSLTKVEIDEDNYYYTAKLKLVDEEENVSYVQCSLVVNEKGNVTSVYYMLDDVKVTVAGTKVNDVSDKVSNLTKELTLGEIIKDIGKDNKVLYAIKDNVIDDIPSAINNLAIQEIYYDEIYKRDTVLEVVACEYNDGYYYYTYAKDSSGNYVYTLVEISSQEDFDKAIADGKNLFTSKTVEYVVPQVGGEDGEGDESQATDESQEEVTMYALFDINYLYYTKNSDGKLVFVNSDGGNGRGKMNAFNADDVYYTYGKALGTWKFMLYEDEIKVTITDETQEGTEGDSQEGEGEQVTGTTFTYYGEGIYSVNELGKLMNNVTQNIENGTMGELIDAGILTISDPSTLDKPITGADDQDKKVRDYKLTEFVNLALKLLTASSGGEGGN